MQIKILTLPFSPSLGAFDTSKLDELVRDREVLAIRELLCQAQGLPHLVCSLTLADLPGGEPRPPTTSPAAPTLDPAAHRRFEALRAWRRDRAHQDGVPPYVILTNRQLGAIATRVPGTTGELRHIDGIGEKKTERYGADVLQVLANGEEPGR